MKPWKGPTHMREKTMRATILVFATLCWAASITLTILIIDGPLSPDRRPGWSTVVILVQSVAITLTVVWAQFRVRRIMVETLKAGIDAGRYASGK